MPAQPSTFPASARLVGIDWGTSNRRAYVVDAEGGCLAAQADDQGVLAARPHFARSLAGMLERLAVPDGVPVVTSGMIGSRQGWREAPYLDLDTPLDALPQHLLAVDDPGLARHCFIVPGYAQRAAAAGIDVMRGEETQLLGAVALGRRDGWIVLPGTHSKWVLLRDGVIQRFATFMTGELYALLGAHGTLAALTDTPGDGGADDAAFEAGVLEARRGAPLSHTLFGVRARVVTGALPAASSRAFLSGLLIGTEYVSAFDLLGEGGKDADGGTRTVAAIGSAALSARHARAAAACGIELTPVDPDLAYCAALARLAEGVPP